MGALRRHPAPLDPFEYAFWTTRLLRVLKRADVSAAVRACGSLGAAVDEHLGGRRVSAPVARFAECCRRAGVGVLTPEAYPEHLAAIDDPPLCLYTRCRSDPRPLLASPGVAVVGARRCTRYGRDVAFDCARTLAASGLGVVSGLALGVDAAAHRGALAARKAGGAPTYAVLGCGVDVVYPRHNASLADDILAAGGVLVSEYPLGVGPRKHHFPERNRLLSGLSSLVVVVEASGRSGSLITARMAREQGRDVCAVPGPVHSPTSAGCHRLIREGAALVASAADVLQELSWPMPGQPPRLDESLSAAERSVLAGLTQDPAPLDELVLAVGLPAEQVTALLVALELRGIVEATPGGYIRRPRFEGSSLA